MVYDEKFFRSYKVALAIGSQMPNIVFANKPPHELRSVPWKGVFDAVAVLPGRKPDANMETPY
jgi:hypothetical protein